MIGETPQEHFRLILLTVAGAAFDAAGYRLDERPMLWAGGLFRFARPFDDDTVAQIDFQLLAYADTEWSSGAPSRFRVTLARGERRRGLGELVVVDFGVGILPDSDHWWTYRNTDELGRALAEAGHLVVGYGMPWLSGDLHPPSAERRSGDVDSE